MDKWQGQLFYSTACLCLQDLSKYQDYLMDKWQGQFFIQLHVCVYCIYQNIRIMSWISDRDSCFIQLHVCVYRIYQNIMDKWQGQLFYSTACLCLQDLLKYQDYLMDKWQRQLFYSTACLGLHVCVYRIISQGFWQGKFWIIQLHVMWGKFRNEYWKKMKLACFCCKSLSEMWVISKKLVDFDPAWLEEVSEFDSGDKSITWIFEKGSLVVINFWHPWSDAGPRFSLQNWNRKWIKILGINLDN